MLAIFKQWERSKACRILLICLVGFVAYAVMLGGTFKTLDDDASIVNNLLIKDFFHIKEILSTSFFGENSYYRPLVSISFMLEYHYFKLDPAPYYVTNIFIHLATAVTVFFLIGLFLKQPRVPFIVALLFTIHPIQWEAVANIPGRAILLSAFFVVTSFYLFCLSRRVKKSSILEIFSLLSFFLALLSKESAFALPVLIISYLWFFEKDRTNRKFRFLGPVWPYMMVVGGVILLRHHLGITKLYYYRSIPELFFGFSTFLRSVITYLRLFIFPHDLHFDRSRELFTSFTHPELVMTISFFIVFSCALFFLRQKIPRNVFFFISWFFIDLLPVSQVFVSIGTQAGRISTAEHFLYSASIGIFVLAAMLVQRLIDQNDEKKIISPLSLRIAFMGVFILFFMKTLEQNILASQEISMLKQSLKYNPKNIRMIESYGYAFVKAHLFKEGEEQFRAVLALDPFHVRARISLGKALCDQGRCVEGLNEYDKVQESGFYQDLLGDNRKAAVAMIIQQYFKRLNQEPLNAQLHYSLGVMYARQERLQEASGYFLKAIELDPVHRAALFNFAGICEALGETQKAVKYFERFLALEAAADNLTQHAMDRLREIKK